MTKVFLTKANTKKQASFQALFYIACFGSFMLLDSCKIQRPEKFYEKVENQTEPIDAIIVPGVPFRDSSWSNVMKLRMHWAKHLWDRGMTKNVILSGGAIYTPYSECKIMRLYAIQMGIPKEHIFIDSLAQHSTENVYYSYYVAQDNGLDRIAVASDPYQTKALKPFVRKLNRKLNTDVLLLPAILDSMNATPMKDYKIDYQQAVDSNFINITETQSLMYRLFGTMGMHIDWKTRPQMGSGNNR